MTIDPNTNIPVTLNAAQWNLVLAQLSEGPYKLVAPLLTMIQEQCMAHDQQPQNIGVQTATPLRAVTDLAGE